MKNRGIILMVSCMLLSLGAMGCGSSPESTTPAASVAASPQSQPLAQATAPSEEPPSQQEPLQQTVSLQNIDIVISGAELVTIDGEKGIGIYFTSVNKSDVIVQSSNEANFIATQSDTELYTAEGETDEQYALGENFDRKIFPGVAIHAAEFFLLEGDAAELILTIADGNEDYSEEIAFDLNALPPVALLEADSEPETDITSITGYSGTEATFEDDYWPDGELKLVEHEFVSQGDDTFIVLYFDLVFTGNLEDGEVDSPVMRTYFNCFQDGVQLGASTVFDDRLKLDTRDQIPELETQKQDIGLNEPVRFATAYVLNSDADVAVVAGFNWSDFSQGEAFIGDVLPVE